MNCKCGTADINICVLCLSVEGLLDEYLSVKIKVLLYTRKHKGVKCDAGERGCVFVCVCGVYECACKKQRCSTITVYCRAAHRLNTVQLGAAAKPGRWSHSSMEEPTL